MINVNGCIFFNFRKNLFLELKKVPPFTFIFKGSKLANASENASVHIN